MSQRLILDTNAYSDFMRGTDWVFPFRHASELHLPIIVVAELRAGFRNGSKTQQNEQTLAAFIASPRVRVCAPNAATTHHYASLYHQLRTQGTPIPLNDLWISALAIQTGAWLCTKDSHFDHLPQIPRLAP